MFQFSDGRRRESLPIDGYLPQILSALRENQVVIVEAETGAGKTTRIPQAILLEMPGVKVWMTQTRRPAVRWNGRRIAWEMGQSPGGVVGWRLRGEKPVVSRRTRLTLLVDQSLVNRIRREGRLPKGVLLIDEAHERSVSTDLLLGLIRQYLPESPKTKVVVTSATIDTKKFSEYFDGAPIISVPGRMYPVETRVQELQYAEHHTSGAIRAACAVMESFAKGELTIVHPDDAGRTLSGELAAEEARRKRVTSGSVLVLLPGKEDIKQAIVSLVRKAEQLGIAEGVQILPCHGEVSGQEQDAVQAKIPQGTIRFVCATEIVRSSVTVPQTVGVIDSLQVKRLITDGKGVAHLKKVAVSKAEADQAKGRAGRTQPGFYIPASFKGEYGQLKQWPVPAILREPIASVVLQVAAVGLSVRTFPFIDAPDEEKVNLAIERLQKLGALDEDEQITDRGRLLVRFPVDPERAQVLVKANELGVLAEAVVAAAVLEQEGILYRPKERRSTVVVGESILRQILAYAADAQYFGEGDKREWRKPTLEEVNLTELPDWVEPNGVGRWKVDCGSYSFPHREGARWVADLVWAEFAAGTGSDYVAAVRAFRAFKAEEWRLRDAAKKARENGNGERGNGTRRGVENQLRQWCFDHHLNYKRLRMVQHTIQQLRDEVASSPLTLRNGIYEQREFDAEALTKALASGLVDQVCRLSGRRTFDGPLAEGIQLGYSSACPENSELILISGVRKIPKRTRRGGTSHMLLTDMAAPIKPEWLLEVMPQLCEPRLRGGSAKFNSQTGEVDGIEDVYYGNVVIQSYPIQVRGKKAAEVLANEMINTRTGLPAEWWAKYLRDLVFDLGEREGVSRSIKGRVRDWFIKRLGEASTRAEAAELDLMLTEDDVSEMLGFNFPEYRERILAERPDYLWVGAYPLRVRYGSFSSATIRVPRLLARRLTPEMLPEWEGLRVKVVVDHPGYSHISAGRDRVEKLAGLIEEQRLKLAWKAFKADGQHGDYDCKIKVPYGEPLPEYPTPEIWDRLTGALAYPALVYYSSYSGEEARTLWHQRWYQTEEEALDARRVAEAKKAEEDAAEYERRNFDALVAEAKALLEEVSSLWEQVHTERYAGYGLKYDEIKTGYYASAETSIPKGLEEARRLVRRKPTRTLESLKRLRDRLEQALAYFAENTKREDEAREVLEAAQKEVAYVEEAYRHSEEITYSEKNAVLGELERAQEAFNSGDYLKAIEKANEALELARPLNARVEAKRRARQVLDDLVEREYAICPICGGETDFDTRRGGNHYCDWDFQEALRARGQYEDFEVKVTRCGEALLARLVAVYDSHYNEYELRFEVNREAAVNDPGTVVTETFWRQPSKREVELSARLAELHQKLGKINEELKLARDPEGNTAGRLELTFVQGTHPKTGEDQWEAVVRKGGITTKYVIDRNSWEQPEASGETWVCTEGRQLVDAPRFKLILVNPQVRVDNALEIRAQIDRLERELAAEQKRQAELVEEPFDEDGQPLTTMAAALRKAGLI